MALDLAYAGPGAVCPGWLELELWALGPSMLQATCPLLLLPPRGSSGDAAAAPVAGALGRLSVGSSRLGFGDPLVEELLCALHGASCASVGAASAEAGAGAWLLDLGTWLHYVHEVVAESQRPTAADTDSAGGPHPDWGGAVQVGASLRVHCPEHAALMARVGQSLLQHARRSGMHLTAQTISHGTTLVALARASLAAAVVAAAEGAAAARGSLGAASEVEVEAAAAGVDGQAEERGVAHEARASRAMGGSARASHAAQQQGQAKQEEEEEEDEDGQLLDKPWPEPAVPPRATAAADDAGEDAFGAAPALELQQQHHQQEQQGQWLELDDATAIKPGSASKGSGKGGVVVGAGGRVFGGAAGPRGRSLLGSTLLGFPDVRLEALYFSQQSARAAGVARLWALLFSAMVLATTQTSLKHGTLVAELPVILMFITPYLLTLLVAWRHKPQSIERAWMVAGIVKAVASVLTGLGLLQQPVGFREAIRMRLDLINETVTITAAEQVRPWRG